MRFGFHMFMVPPGELPAVAHCADEAGWDCLQVADAPFVGGPAWRVGIFLSVFDVHVNRVPLAGRVLHRAHRPGRFLDARDPRCASDNEAAEIGIECPRAGQPPVRILVRQITGLIARRIVCPVRIGQDFERGQRYGMIKFGSRTEVYVLDRDLEALAVKVGDRVKGGASVIGRIKSGQAGREAA